MHEPDVCKCRWKGAGDTARRSIQKKTGLARPSQLLLGLCKIATHARLIYLRSHQVVQSQDWRIAARKFIFDRKDA